MDLKFLSALFLLYQQITKSKKKKLIINFKLMNDGIFKHYGFISCCGKSMIQDSTCYNVCSNRYKQAFPHQPLIFLSL